MGAWAGCELGVVGVATGGAGAAACAGAAAGGVGVFGASPDFRSASPDFRAASPDFRSGGGAAGAEPTTDVRNSSSLKSLPLPFPLARSEERRVGKEC